MSEEKPAPTREGVPLVIAVYGGHTIEPMQLPQEMWTWSVIDEWLLNMKMPETQRNAIKTILLHGQAHKMRTPTNIPVTLYAVLQTGRAIDDLRRAKLMVAKVQGSA